MKQKKQTQEKETTNIPIPISLFKKIKERIKETGFTSVSDYVIYVLNEILTEEEEEKPSQRKTKKKSKND